VKVAGLHIWASVCIYPHVASVRPAPAGDAATALAPMTAVDRVGDFEAFYERERTRVFRAMCLIAGDRIEADDLTQDAFLRLWERWDRLDGVDDVTAYLFRVAINEHKMRRRRRAIARRIGVISTIARDELEAVETRHRVDAMLERLPRRQREALVLTGYLELTGETAARAMRTTPENVRSLASQARRACREMEERGDD
jgi:RNA polymerase sigma-70 factor, ECF subfamily